jgi:tetratricopeptide (TPR) repeat protein
MAVKFPILFAAALLLPVTSGVARTPLKTSLRNLQPAPFKKNEPQDDSIVLAPAKDLTLQPGAARKADALAQFVEGERWEELGEMEKAIDSYQKVLNVDPGQVDLATHVATLLTRQDDYPTAVDVLKDAIKANPKDAAPYLQLAAIYSKDLKKMDQASKYAEQALALDPQNIEVYQRLYEIEIAVGQPQKALETLDRALNVPSKDASFWVQLGKLFASVIFKADTAPKPEELQRVNSIFTKAADLGADDPAVLKDVADYFAASQQIKQALPFYLKVLERAPDDANAREKLATGFVLTNQWPQAIQMLQEIVQSHPEKWQAYELLAGVYEDEARSFDRNNQAEQARADFAKAAQNYEQSLLINSNRPTNYLRLAELLLGKLRENERAVRILRDARHRFPDLPEMTYYLAIALREARQPQAAVTTFEEALHEAELSSSEIVNARFYFDYGATAEQAGLYEKAADLFKRSIAIDPANAAEAYNYLGYMWADHNMHLEEAEQMIKRALETDPNNGAYLDSMGWLYYRKGKYTDALDQLQHALKNIPKPDATVLVHVGDTFSKLNRVAQALEYWQKAILLAPDDKTVAAKIENAKTKLSKGPPATTNPIQ